MITLVIIGLWILAFLILNGLQCGGRFSALWIGSINDVRCCHISKFLLSLAISDFLLDIGIICLPLPMASLPTADELNARD